MLRAVVLTQYRRVTDGRTDGIAVANTALAISESIPGNPVSRAPGIPDDFSFPFPGNFPD